MVQRILALVVIVTILALLLVYSQHRPVPNKVSGFIEAYEVRVGSRVGGRVQEVRAVEGQSVHAGDLLVRLEPYDLHERLAEATQQLAAKEADYQRLKAGPRAEEIGQAAARRDQIAARLEKLKAGPRKQEIAEAAAQVQQAEAQRDLAQASLARVQALSRTSGTTQEELDRAANQYKVTAATLVVRQEELALLQEGSRKEDIAESAAQLAEADQALALLKAGYRAEDIAAAQAAVDALHRQVEELQIKAPLAGTVEAVELRPGDLLAPNAPALSLLDNSELWVRAYVPENRLNIKAGDAVRLTVDAFPGQEFGGRITFVSRQAEFTPGNVQTPEDRSKQVFRIKVTLDKEAMQTLRAGMSADVWLTNK